MRILVIGGDAFQNPRAVFVRLDDLCIENERENPKDRYVLMWPEDSKAGFIADLWARKRGVVTNKWPRPLWFAIPPAILVEGMPDVVVAYPGAPAHLVQRAQRRGIRVIKAT